ncbi:amino acid permease/ SLC12A domain-containing protein [Hypoxylon sp. NC1633]|nr:amino acid permease/ SLC12A domain-containing protein [Hypoxylon sp. NC1633]
MGISSTPQIEVQTASTPTHDDAPLERAQAQASSNSTTDSGLHRSLKNRHLSMIAFGGVIGASVWNGAGAAISSSGPAGALICFLIIGVDVFFVMQSVGEMSTLFPIQGAFIELAGRFIDPALAFSLGINYFYLWISSIAHDYNNLARTMDLWTDALPSYAWFLLFWVGFQCTSLLDVVVYGDMEVFLASWKLICIAGGFLVAILLNTGAIGGEYIGFHYWSNPGAFVNGIGGFGKSFVLAAVYFSGTEMVALAAAESRNPEKDLPKAIRHTFWRILITLCGLVFFAGIIVPFNDDNLLTATSKSAQSPWAVALVRAGWDSAENLVNVVMVTAHLSSINSAIYVASRILVALASNGRAPKFFARTTTRGVPVNAIVFSNLFGFVALLNIATSPGLVYKYLINISDGAAYIAWAFIGITHLRLRKAWALQGRSPDELPFRAFLYPYGAWFVVILNLFLVIISGYEAFVGGFTAGDFVVSYLVILIFALLYVGWKYAKGTKVVSLAEADLVTGRLDYSTRLKEDDSSQTRPKGPWYVTVKRFIYPKH